MRFCFQNIPAYLLAMASHMAAVHWLLRAEEARCLAGETYNLDARRMMIGIASGYEKLAEQAASLADSGVPVEEINTILD
jgi:hypothetical protein